MVKRNVLQQLAYKLMARSYYIGNDDMTLAYLLYAKKCLKKILYMSSVNISFVFSTLL